MVVALPVIGTSPPPGRSEALIFFLFLYFFFFSFFCLLAQVPLMFNQTFDPGFFISLHNKDLGIARDVSERTRIMIYAKPLQALTLVREMNKDLSALVQVHTGDRTNITGDQCVAVWSTRRLGG